MNSKLTCRRYLWMILIPLLVGCSPATATVAPSTAVDMNVFATQISGTVVAEITQEAYVTPSKTLPPKRTPYPTETPRPVYSLDEKLKASIVDGNLYVQNGKGENIQLTDSKADSNPIFSGDGKKIIFHRGTDNSYYSIETDGSNEQKIFNVPSLAVQDYAEIKALTFIKNTHILLFNIYICGPHPSYNVANCFVSTYSVDADSGKTEEIGQRVSGIRFDDSNFVLSPNQQYLSIAGSGHINIFSFSAGHFKLAYFGAFTYSMTRGYEFLPYQYWLPDSSGLIIVSASTGTSNSAPDPPSFYDVFRYTLGKKVVQINDITPRIGGLWRMGCVVSVSPDRNWMFFIGKDAWTRQDGQPVRLGNLNDSRSQVYNFGEMPCSNIQWSPDSKHFAITNIRPGRIGSVDGSPLTKLDGYFDGWIDATHYSYITLSNGDIKTAKYYTAEIGGASILVLTPTPTPPP